MLVPGPDYPGFIAFQAQEPAGKGTLIALAVPDNFDVKRFAAGPSLIEKGIQPVSDPPGYFMRVIRQIEIAVAPGFRGWRHAQGGAFRLGIRYRSL